MNMNINMYNNFLDWFHKNQQELKKMSPTKAKRTIIHEMLLRGITSPALKGIQLQIGPDGKITDASLSFMETQMDKRIISSKAFYTIIKKHKKEKNSRPTPIQVITEELEEIIPEHDDENCKICNIEFNEEFHSKVNDLAEQGQDPKPFVAGYVKEKIQNALEILQEESKGPVENAPEKINNQQSVKPESVNETATANVSQENASEQASQEQSPEQNNQQPEQNNQQNEEQSANPKTKKARTDMDFDIMMELS